MRSLVKAIRFADACLDVTGELEQRLWAGGKTLGKETIRDGPPGKLYWIVRGHLPSCNAGIAAALYSCGGHGLLHRDGQRAGEEKQAQCAVCVVRHSGC